MTTAIPKIVHGEVRVTAIYVHSNPEKCQWRGPKNSNLYNNPEKLSMAEIQMTSEVSSKLRCVEMIHVPDKLKNKANAATETSPKKFQYNLKKRDEVGGL